MNFNTYSNKVNGLEEITDAELRSALKRINDRIKQLANANMQNSISYQSYVSFANKYGGVTQSYNKKTGKFSAPSIKIGSIKKLSEQEKREILEKDRHGGSIGTETQKAIDYIRKTKPDFAKHKGRRTQEEIEEIQKTASKLGKVHDYIEEHDYMIYAVEDAKGNFIRGNNGELTPEEVDRLFNIEYEYNQLNTEAHHDEPTKKWNDLESNNPFTHRATPSASNDDYISRINRWQ